MKKGIIDVGGGLRGIYAAGVFDYLMDHNIRFDYGIGISAGSGNMTNYAAGQRGRTYTYFRDYSQRPEYMSWKNLAVHRSYVDLDYVYSTLANALGEYPFDYEAMVENPMEILTIATNAHTGRPAYFDKEYLSQDDYAILKASCAIPVACHPYKVKNLEYFDGGISDPIPLQRALNDGCGKIVLILTKPKDYFRDPAHDARYIALLKKRYPKAAEVFENRAFQYNTMLSLALQLEKEGRVLIIAPRNTRDMKTLDKDQDKLDALYEAGYADAAAIPEFLGA